MTALLRPWFQAALLSLTMLPPLILAIVGCSSEKRLPRATENPQPAPLTASPPEMQSTASGFRDVTDSTGIHFRFSSGRDAGEFAILESLGGGVGVFDFDLDGNFDLMFAGGGQLSDQTVTSRSSALFRNLGDFRFVDVTTQTGTAADRFYTQGVFPADFDNDGFQDVVVSGYGGVQFFRNQGDGTLLELDDWSAQIDQQWSTGIAWGDFTGDGNLDLYIPHYVSWSWQENPPCYANSGNDREICSPTRFRGLDDALYLSDGRGGFELASQAAGLRDGGKGLGAVAADLDLDGDTDIYVANDTTDNFLYLNDGHGVFTESAIVAGVSGDDVGVSTGSMGIAIADSNADGMPDIWVTNFESELFALYRNEGAGSFTHISRPAGLAELGGLFVGFGTQFVDFDHDSDPDIVVANGHVFERSRDSPYLQQPLLLENRGDGRFKRLPPAGYFAESHSGRGLATADLNNDGALDLIFCHAEEPVSILAGTLPQDSTVALVQLVGRNANRDAIGATLQMLTGGQQQSFSRVGGGSYLSQSDPRTLLVLKKGEKQAEVLVEWGSGHSEIFPFPTENMHAIWVEETGEPR